MNRGIVAGLTPAIKKRLWPSPYAVLLCLAIIALADLVIWRVHTSYLVKGLLDEPAHAATGLLVLLAVCLVPSRRVVLAVLAGAVLIDLDHIPHVLGSSILEHGVPRPYPHSLIMLLVLAVVAALIRDSRRRTLVVIAGAAVAVHLIRDVAEPGGPGVALLWPLSDHSFAISYVPYALALVAFALVAVGRRSNGPSPATDES